MSKLTDMQLVILSAASQRDDRGVELPANVKGEAARKVVPPAKLCPKPSPLASKFPLQCRSPLVRSIMRASRRPKLVCEAKAGRTRNKLGCLRCCADQRE